jgi:hypothetical protein
MKKSSVCQMKIPATESKMMYLEQIEEMCEKWARQPEGRELDIHIKEMHTHMRGTELKEEELQKCEEALKKREEELVIHE